MGDLLDDVARLQHRNCDGCGSTITRQTIRVRITYAIEPAPSGAGFVVWRRDARGQEVALGIWRQAIIYRTRATAEDAIRRARVSDRGAATLLGVELVEG